VRTFNAMSGSLDIGCRNLPWPRCRRGEQSADEDYRPGDDRSAMSSTEESASSDSDDEPIVSRYVVAWAGATMRWSVAQSRMKTGPGGVAQAIYTPPRPPSRPSSPRTRYPRKSSRELPQKFALSSDESDDNEPIVRRCGAGPRHSAVNAACSPIMRTSFHLISPFLPHSRPPSRADDQPLASARPPAASDVASVTRKPR
jgi:hypothetical protein